MSLIRRATVSSSGLPSPPASQENWTITCYSCGMPSSSVWAKLVKTHPDSSSDSTSSTSAPYFPNLSELSCPNGGTLSEDGTTHLCAFCFASLESQWNNYEKQSDPAHPRDRKYSLQKFDCAVCGVQTYRKRIRALPFQEFPFLTKDRQPGSLTLGQNPLAIVCLDCSETLWAQSAEYERWGLPIQKRHFNWMARPPPPENSMEATVARLPSGETQLPRCPPVEPSVTKGRAPLYSELTNAQTNGVDSRPTKVEFVRRNYKALTMSLQASNRKSSAPCFPSTDAQFPPVVTVAPMSSHRDSISVRKGASSVPPLAAELMKSHSNSNSNSNSSESLPPTLGLQFAASRPVPSFLDSPAFKALQWHQRDFNPYNSLETSQTNPWPWIPSPSPHPHAPDFVNYQSYLASLASRSISAAETYVPPPSIYPGALQIPSNPRGLSTAGYTASFLAPTPTTLTNENGHFSPRTASSDLFISPLLNNSHEHSSRTSSSSTEVNKFHSMKRKGSFSGNCDIPSKARAANGKYENHHRHYSDSQKNADVLNYSLARRSSNASSIASHKITSNSFALTPHFKKRWNEAASDDFAVDLSKKTGFISPVSGANNIRTRSNSFSVAFLCNNETLSPPEPASRSSSRDSVIVVPANDVNDLTNTNNKESQTCELTPAANSVNSDKNSPAIPSVISEEQQPQNPHNLASQMTDEEVKQFVEKTKAAYTLEQIKLKAEQKQMEEQKQDFLKPLNLVTASEASEIELKKVISRAEKGTLAPLELRPDSPKDELEAFLQNKIRRAITENKFSNILEIDGGNPDDQHDFLEQLGLKVASENERIRIEQQWCLTLLEKLLRVSRNGANKGRKWSADELSKLATDLAKICRVDSTNGFQSNEPFTNLSVILSPEAEDLLTKQWMFNSSDLLSIVSDGCGPNTKEALESESEGKSRLAIISPVISYPKYIPSYANVDNELESEKIKNENVDTPEQRLNGSILNIPSVVRHSSSGTTTTTSQQPEAIQSHDRDSTANVSSSISIPKVPTKRSTTHCENRNPEQDPKPKRVQRKDSSEGKLVQVNTNSGIVSNKNLNHVKQSSTIVDDIIGRYTGLVKGLRNEIDNLLSSALSTKEDRNGETHNTVDQIRRLRCAIATYQTDMKLIDRRLRKNEKEMTRPKIVNNGSGGLEKNTHCIQNTSSNFVELEQKSNGFA